MKFRLALFEQGMLRAFKGELIHIYNKREGALLNTGLFKELRSKPNVEERKQSYLDSYDIVLVNDESLEIPNAVLHYLTSKK
ncbi:hypothetical protein XENOCAPTIV_015029 [Xenoophorus captivus]|uniref:7-methylguanosine nucleotidase n=1 Tax=Xenoophorus captivus TaxID=1517983 RepID=A0ABV0R4Z8_9TELE